MPDFTIYTTKSFEQITSISSSTGLTDGTYNASNIVYALIQCTGGAIRYRTDGSTPETGIGHYLANYGAVEVWGGVDLSNFRAIDSGGTAKLEVTYFGVVGGA